MLITRERIFRLSGIAILLSVAIGSMLFLERFHITSNSKFWKSVINFGHIPLFGLMAIILLWLLRLSFGKRIKLPLQYAISWMGAIGIGALSEYLQISTYRDADLMDWLFDIAGATVFLSLYFTIDSRSPYSRQRKQLRRKIIIRIVMVLIIVAAGIPLLKSSAAQLHRRTFFPMLYTFDNYFDKEFLNTSYAEFEIVDSPDEWKNHISKVVKVTFFPARHPTLYCEGPFSDWSSYQALELNVYSAADYPMDLHFSIKDHEGAKYHDRYNGNLRIQPGNNRLEISLFEIAHAPAMRTMDLSSIQVICIFLIDPKKRVVLYFDDLHLH